MTTRPNEFPKTVRTLLTNVEDLLESPDPRTRARAVHWLAAGVRGLERQVLLDAQTSGMSWADIGDVYGISRQAAHRRFSDETVVASDFFDGLLADLESEDEPLPALAQAAKRARYAAESS